MSTQCSMFVQERAAGQENEYIASIEANCNLLSSPEAFLVKYPGANIIEYVENGTFKKVTLLECDERELPSRKRAYQAAIGLNIAKGSKISTAKLYANDTLLLTVNDSYYLGSDWIVFSDITYQLVKFKAGHTSETDAVEYIQHVLQKTGVCYFGFLPTCDKVTCNAVHTFARSSGAIKLDDNNPDSVGIPVFFRITDTTSTCTDTDQTQIDQDCIVAEKILHQQVRELRQTWKTDSPE